MTTHGGSEATARPLRIAICGGGALAVILLRALHRWSESPVHVTIFEPRARRGTGLAYSTTCPAHLLNTRARTMSVTEDPRDFANWVRTNRPRKVLNWSDDDFLPRRYFAEYLESRLAETQSATNLHITWVSTAADSLLPANRGWQVVPARGEPVDVDIVVLATGNEAPRPLGGALPPALQDRIINDPWDETQKARILPHEPVLIVGTGLTAVDIAQEMLERGHTGRIEMISRRGLLPRSHGAAADVPDGLVHSLPASLREIVRHVRRLCGDDPRGERWRRVFVELRSVAPVLWRGWSTAERKRFLRHVRPFWDAHRHRVPQSVHRRLARAQTQGQIEIHKGRVRQIRVGAAGLLEIETLHGGRRSWLHASRVVNCTGGEPDPRQSSNSLLRALLTDGHARADALGLGLATDAKCRVIAADGSAQGNLSALGALTRGANWEITALAEIREQAHAFVRHLLRERRAIRRAASMEKEPASTRRAPLARVSLRT